MSRYTKIESADATCNAVIGCKPVSEGCRFCAAARMASGSLGRNNPAYAGVAVGGQWSGKVVFNQEALQDLKSWRKPLNVLVSFMGDIFQDDLADCDREQIWDTLYSHPQHTYQVLTKYTDNMVRFLEGRNIPPYIWIGVSVENDIRAAERIEKLQEINAKVRFCYYEPALGPVDWRWPWLNWIVAGGESGVLARTPHPFWFRNTYIWALEHGIPFCFKSWGSWQPVCAYLPREDATQVLANYGCELVAVDPVGTISARRNYPKTEQEWEYSKARPGSWWMARVTKRIAGRTLDGCIWNEKPRNRAPQMALDFVL